MNTVASKKSSHPWSQEALFRKAQLYAQEMQRHSRDEWLFGLTSTFVLEFVARAALAHISPTLLADGKDWNNTYYSLGYTPTAQKFIPRSIDVTSVFSHLQDVIPSFTTELTGFAAKYINRRNEELHSGSTPFIGLPTDWLPKFYEACDVLLKSMNDQLSSLFGESESQVAITLITASHDESAKTVIKSISAHKTVWEAIEPTEAKILSGQAATWAMRQSGHRVKCPACGNDALLHGSPISEPIRKLDGDLIVEAQEYLPSKFECVACKLKIAGLSQLNACGLGATYKATFTYEAADYYAPEDKYANFDDDNNEP